MRAVYSVSVVLCGVGTVCRWYCEGCVQCVAGIVWFGTVCRWYCVGLVDVCRWYCVGLVQCVGAWWYCEVWYSV